MSYYKFKKNDILKNTLIVYPKINFKIFKNNIYYNNIKLTNDVSDGYAHIFDLNINPSECDSGQLDFSCADSSAYIAII